MFDLDKTLAAWRRSYMQRRAFSPEDLDELEQHLRDQVETLIKEGLTEKAALAQALKDMGAWDEAEVEYGKVFWGKIKRQRRLREELIWRFEMFKNYLLVALRSLRKQKVYAFINVFGLAAGLASFILIVLFVQYEFSYDRFYADTDNIYRVTKRVPGDVYLGTDHFAVTQPPLASRMAEEFQEIESATSYYEHDILASYNGNVYWEKGIWGDTHFFEVFGLDLIAGDPVSALAEPYTIVLTASLAEKIFGGLDPMNRVLVIEDLDSYKVTGVIQDPPANSSIQYQFIISVTSDPWYVTQLAETRWNSNNMYTFFRLANGAGAEQLQAKLPAFVDKYIYPDRQDIPSAEKEQFFIQPLRDVHLRSFANFEFGRPGNLTQVYLFIAIAIVILLLACINYVNLAIARSIKRAGEVGLRKTVGAVRAQLIWQFLGESFMMTAMAMLLALGLVHLLLPFFSGLIERDLAMNYFRNIVLLPGLAGLLLLVSVFSGSYPALLMSSLRPIEVFKRKGATTRFNLQRMLVIGQYTASIVLIACGLVIYQQLTFVQDKEIGYDRAHILNVSVQDHDVAFKANIPRIQTALLQHANIAHVTASGSLPTNITWQQTIRAWEGADPDDVLQIHVNPVDYGFIEVFGMELAAGRTFSRDRSSDAASGCLINETTARALGWTAEEALGRQFIHDNKPRTVVGVMKDFHLHSLHHPIKPLLFFIDDGGRFDYISAKIMPGNLQATIDFIEETVQPLSNFPFQFQFLDDQFDLMYAQERRLGETFGFFTAIAFLIASLGLFGLAAYAAEQRTKEIGIRKVLGASARGIISMMTRDFTQLVLVSVLIATPISYLLMRRWLESFAYSIELGPGVFIFAGLLTLTIAALSVSYQAIKASTVNPVQSLRSD